MIQILNRSLPLYVKATRHARDAIAPMSLSLPLVMQYWRRPTISILSSQQQHRSVYMVKDEFTLPLRRIRKPFNQLKDFKPAIPPIEFDDLNLPYSHGESTMDEYLKKASLSPWVPTPDANARKMMDLANASASDFHVDLGCGDGRVNFHAIDYGEVSKSIGIDIDENILQIARKRLQRRHPQPDLEFVAVDLVNDMNHPVWEQIKQATIITMYFATEGLEKIKPVLERKLTGRKCKIITCDYKMPGWIVEKHEVLNAITLYMYEWGTYYTEEELESRFIPLPEGTSSTPEENPLQNTPYRDAKVIDRTMGLTPGLLMTNTEDDDEDEDYDWDEELKSVGYSMRGETLFGLSVNQKKALAEEAAAAAAKEAVAVAEKEAAAAKKKEEAAVAKAANSKSDTDTKDNNNTKDNENNADVEITVEKTVRGK